MAEQNAEFADLAITIQAGKRRILVPGKYAFVGTKGIFVLDRQLGVGTPVVVRLLKNQMAVSLHGVVCENYKDLGFAIVYAEKTGSAARELASLLAAEFDSSFVA